MTREERVEAAAKLIGFPWHKASEEERKLARARAAAYLSTAFPELFSDPPTAWVAPLEMPDDENDWDNWMHAAWEAARDAHTKVET